jgi:hypothetical protein
MPILDFAPTVGLRRSGLTIIGLHDDMWRITGATGDVVGYVERFPSPEGLRFRAKRLLPRQGRFMVDGEFWSMDDAIACFR